MGLDLAQAAQLAHADALSPDSSGGLVTALSVGAGLVHAAVTREHFDEHLAYGAFFASVGVAQIVWPVWVIRTRSRAALTIGLVGTTGIVAIWVVSRALGLPVGPDAFEPERVGVSDGLATALEADVVVGCVLLLRGPFKKRVGPLPKPAGWRSHAGWRGSPPGGSSPGAGARI